MQAPTRWLVAAAVTLWAASAWPAAAHPNTTGCPTGWEAVLVSTLTGTPYEPALGIDASGNHDGMLCRQSLPDAYRDHAFGGAFAEAPAPVVYWWRDNTVGSRG